MLDVFLDRMLKIQFVPHEVLLVLLRVRLCRDSDLTWLDLVAKPPLWRHVGLLDLEETLLLLGFNHFELLAQLVTLAGSPLGDVLFADTGLAGPHLHVECVQEIILAAVGPLVKVIEALQVGTLVWVVAFAPAEA